MLLQKPMIYAPADTCHICSCSSTSCMFIFHDFFFFSNQQDNEQSKLTELLEFLKDDFKPGMKYPEAIRAFSLKLNFLSPKAYVFVRTMFCNRLPHPKTISAWYRNSNLDAKSGISEASLQILQREALRLKERGMQLLCSLSFDEMVIRRHLQWSNSENKFLGTVTYGPDGNEIANNAIVFLANGINSHIQAPVAYYFITSLSGEQRKEILLEILKVFFEREISVSNITFDGLPANATMCELLGARLERDRTKTFFIDPYTNLPIYIIFDPSHCVKLVRNNLSNHTIWDGYGEKISWRFFEDLVSCSEKNMLKTHKMNSRHINFENRKMHVRTAVETLSNSVADSMKFLQEQNFGNFANAAATIKFIRIFNSLFDVQNTQRMIHDHSNQLKSAFNVQNKDEVIALLLEAKQYIIDLKVTQNEQRIPIINSRVKTGFRGFLVNIDSIIGLYNDYVEEKNMMKMLATYRLSQDHLEMMFGRIRSMHGCNDNTTVQQFQASYKRLQLIGDMAAPIGSNVSQISSNIMTVSSASQKQNGIDQSQNPEESVGIINFEQIQHGEYLIDACATGSIAFAAYTIENRILDCGQIYCKLCEKAFREDEKVDQMCCVGRKSPSSSIFRVCKVTDSVVKQIISNVKQNFKAKVMNTVMSNLDFNLIFPHHFEPEHEIEHKYFIVRFIISEYTNIITYLSKLKTIEMHKNYFRHTYRKNILFAGQ